MENSNIKVVVDKKEQFLQKIKHVYPDNFTEVIEGISKPRKKSFRLICTKDEELGVMASLRESFVVRKGPFVNSYSVEEENTVRLSEHQVFLDNKIYIQSFSSMLPVYILDPNPGEKIIDLCAAPGSKTSLLAKITEGRADIYASDNNQSRMLSLKNNLSAQGIDNVVFIKQNVSYLPKDLSKIGIFDRVLADVPCSNEGVIREPDNYNFKYWSLKHSKNLPQLQKKILASGIKLLKKGGELVYSTCTYSPQENEAVINWALKTFNDVTVGDINGIPEKYVLNSGNLNMLEKPFLKGFTQWDGKKYHKDLSKSLRVLPNELFDGFYICRLLKL